jgi:hypothetical protein
MVNKVVELSQKKGLAESTPKQTELTNIKIFRFKKEGNPRLLLDFLEK